MAPNKTFEWYCGVQGVDMKNGLESSIKIEVLF